MKPYSRLVHGLPSELPRSGGGLQGRLRPAVAGYDEIILHRDRPGADGFRSGHQGHAFRYHGVPMYAQRRGVVMSSDPSKIRTRGAWARSARRSDDLAHRRPATHRVGPHEVHTLSPWNGTQPRPPTTKHWLRSRRPQTIALRQLICPGRPCNACLHFNQTRGAVSV